MNFSLLGMQLSISRATPSTPMTGQPPQSIEVCFGNPTFTHRLTYQKMYSEKPFEHAVLYYYDNGVYKIISPGEEHYGVYVMDGEIIDADYRISYISLPHADWGDNVARHDLTFHRESLIFQQQALAHVDKNIPLQNGTFILGVNTLDNPIGEKWPSTV